MASIKNDSLCVNRLGRNLGKEGWRMELRSPWLMLRVGCPQPQGSLVQEQGVGGIWVLWASPAPSLLLFIAGRLTSPGAWCCLWTLERGRGPQGAPVHLTLVTSAALRASKAMSSMSSSSP